MFSGFKLKTWSKTRVGGWGSFSACFSELRKVAKSCVIFKFFLRTSRFTQYPALFLSFFVGNHSFFTFYPIPSTFWGSELTPKSAAGGLKIDIFTLFSQNRSFFSLFMQFFAIFVDSGGSSGLILALQGGGPGGGPGSVSGGLE